MPKDKERRSINEVIDRPAITAVRLLVGITAIAVALVAYMGDRVIKNQDNQLKEMSDINASLNVYESKISRNTSDISKNAQAITNVSDRVSKLQGFK